jgi:TolB-like protein
MEEMAASSTLKPTRKAAAGSPLKREDGSGTADHGGRKPPAACQARPGSRTEPLVHDPARAYGFGNDLADCECSVPHSTNWEVHREGNAGNPPATGICSIAVLRLVNLSSDPSQEYLSDGLSDELISRLAKIGSLPGISCTSVIGYKRSVKRAPEIGDELHVDNIIEGAVERVHDRVRIACS